ncbi:hypothetical protein PIIN_11106 [Serendipita indica DSM 11827]|uniref:BTB domain-containing protein n=1 Tax=Serendipita indica (strain DSM 11827) TaxID=1109443 RepID=G4U0N0_SERID|nr:hypothetical protein PIIN_11106 [Serendipita indica DSM 11827]
MDISFTEETQRYGPGYGDFVLQSSDGKDFHFPRAILAFTSGFFKDMFDLPNSSTAEGTPEKPLVLTESSQLVQMLLDVVNPNAPSPPLVLAKPVDLCRFLMGLIDPNESPFVYLLEAAHKYRIPCIFRWFEKEAIRAQVNEENREETPAILDKCPVFVLACARQHNLPQIGRLAIRELVKRPSLLLDEDVDLPPKLYRGIYGWANSEM